MKSTKKKRSFLKKLNQNKAYLLMAIPGAVWLIFFFYIPVLGNVVAFKDFRYSEGGFLASLKESPWVGFKNFEFLFSSDNAYLITRNTILYNLGFIIIGLIFAIFFAVILSELRSRKLIKVYQTTMLFPYFLSWVIISYFVYSFLSPEKGLINNLFGLDINWYNEPKFWPVILLIIGVWKGVGYNSIIYFASIMGIDPSYYEAAMVDGASKWQQIKNVTLPQLIPLISILSILAVGNIFKADFGLFYNIPRNSGALYEVTSVLDTYIYNGLTSTGDIGMAAAAGLYQSAVGCILLVTTNFIVRRFDDESALF